MRSALFSTQGLLSGTPPDARGPQAGSPLACRPARPCAWSPCATGVLALGPETRSWPAARSSEPHFLPAGRGEAESISCCALTAAETSSQSATSGGRPGAKVQPRAGAGARRRGREPRLPPHPRVWDLLSRSRPLDTLPSTGALYCRAHFPQKGKHLQGLQEPLSRLSPDSDSLTGLSTGNLF